MGVGGGGGEAMTGKPARQNCSFPGLPPAGSLGKCRQKWIFYAPLLTSGLIGSLLLKRPLVPVSRATRNPEADGDFNMVTHHQPSGNTLLSSHCQGLCSQALGPRHPLGSLLNSKEPPPNFLPP
uniref:Uncharacterized protein n=1 Tax=Mustela putorius furo TaxID=9669 RepID=M3YQQ3_MUSPF